MDWIVDQRRQMDLLNRASGSAQWESAHDEGRFRYDHLYCCGEYTRDVSEHIHYYDIQGSISPAVVLTKEILAATRDDDNLSCNLYYCNEWEKST